LPTCLSGGGDQSDVRVCSNDRDKVELLSQPPGPHAERVLASRLARCSGSRTDKREREWPLSDRPGRGTLGTIERSQCLNPAGRVIWLRFSSLAPIPNGDPRQRSQRTQKAWPPPGRRPCTSHALTAAKCTRFPSATPTSNLRSKMAPIRLLLTGRRIWRQHLLRGFSRAGQIGSVRVFSEASRARPRPLCDGIISAGRCAPQGDAHGLTDVKGRYKPLNAAKQFRSDWYVPRDLSLI